MTVSLPPFNDVRVRHALNCAVDRVSLAVHPAETLGLVGQSGCGKSALGRCLTRLSEISDGAFDCAGRPTGHAMSRQLRGYRRAVQTIVPDPSASLNPRRIVAEITAEPLRVDRIRPRAGVKPRLLELMELVARPQTISTVIRMNSQAGSAGASASHGRSPWSRSSWSPTNRSRRSTSRSRPRSSTRSPICGNGSRSPTFSSPTTSPWSGRSRPGSR